MRDSVDDATRAGAIGVSNGRLHEIPSTPASKRPPAMNYRLSIAFMMRRIRITGFPPKKFPTAEASIPVAISYR
jgi:hypothetical protein